jgi:hypothetical protein
MSFPASNHRAVNLLLIALLQGSVCFGADLTPETIVAKHLDSIGTAQARNSVKSRVVQAAATYRIHSGGSGAIDGKSIIASEGRKSNFLFKINTNGYRGEQFICDGDKTSIAGTYADHTRSEFGDFLLGQNVVVREPLLAGVWTTGWPLLDIEGHKAQLHFEGTKKVDGHEVVALRFRPKKGTDLDITLYFDPTTFRHVMTSYRATQQTGLGEDEIATARKTPTRYEIEERFSDFQTTDGITLPYHYDLRFTVEQETGFTKSVEWEVKALNIMNNETIDPRSFQVK